MQQLFLILLLGLCISLSANAQDQDHVPNQFLIQLAPKQSIKNLLPRLQGYSKDIEWATPKRLIPNMDIWQLEFNGTANEAQVLEFLHSLSSVEIAQYNHKVTLRSPAPLATTPNDPSFNNQWQYINPGPGIGIDLDADLAWDITTGGVTASNDTIVVAILDNGIHPSQTDFGDNLWVNDAEIPNTHIDDDGNGYEDDYLGWNSTTSSDLIAGGGHGTSVAGIVGAKGNNGQGVTGVNWNVKMMIIRNDWSVDEANVLAAYGYALTQRRIYNQTNGAQGAYVVATNASWGLNNGQPSAAPLWCAFYDTLGAYGILNIAATANASVDVDVVGDLPTACPSDYLVAVTNVNRLGYKELAAGYGSTSIDLGAFGSGVYTTISPSGYGTFGGTSGAAPHVAGAVALMYSGACNNFMAYSRVHPDSAALKMKDYLLNGVVNIVDLNNTTVSGGYLNLYNSLLLCVNDCPTHTCFAPYLVTTNNITDTEATIKWTFPSTVNQVQYRYRIQGGTWNTTTPLAAGQDSVVLNNLMSCSYYEVELISLCNSSSGDTTSITIKTDGCCEPPQTVASTSIKKDSALFNWSPVLVANNYLINYRLTGSATWQTTTTSNNSSYWLTGLDSCASYEAMIQTICNNGDTTMPSDTVQFFTLGCSSCSHITYCTAQGNNSSDDWIDTFSIDNFVHASGNNNGYLFYDSINLYLGRGDFHHIAISQGKTFTESVKVWLDINQDGDFDDVDEEIYSTFMGTTDKTKRGSIIVPASTLLGVTRLRVAMRWNNPPAPCGTVDFGEVEDYCVQIVPGTSIRQLPKGLNGVEVYPTPFSDEITVQLNLAQESDLQLEIYSATGQRVHQQSLETLSTGTQKIVLTPNIPSGVYFLQVHDGKHQVSKRIIKM